LNLILVISAAVGATDEAASVAGIEASKQNLDKLLTNAQISPFFVNIFFL
jgi:hypothetical protein